MNPNKTDIFLKELVITMKNIAINFLSLVSIATVLISSAESSQSTKPNLSTLAIEHHCDKGPHAYNYTALYEKYFNILQESPINFLEINTGYSGFNARTMWDRYFTHPNATLNFIVPTNDYAHPNFRDYAQHSPLFQLSSRCQLNTIDQTDTQKLAQFAHNNKPFDVIIDDGLHASDGQIATFKTLFPHVKPGGVYIIEDIFTSYASTQPLIDERSSSNALTMLNNAPYTETSLKLLENSTIQFLKEQIDALNYTAAKSPVNFTKVNFSILYDYIKQWPTVINKELQEYAETIESINYYSNLCIITKSSQPLHKKKCGNLASPIQFCISESKMVKTIPTKTRDFAFIVPGDLKTYIYDNEADYYKGYQDARYAVTRCKDGWDCLRHYEILANGCIPYFIDLDQCHPNTMHFLPKKLIQEAMNLPGVSYLTIDHTQFDVQKYNELLKKLLEHTRNHLTTRSMAQYLLKKINYSGTGSVLFLFEPCFETEYLRDLILTGLKEELGTKVIDFPKSGVIYKNYQGNTKQLYGKGFSYTKIVDDLPINRSNIEERIKNKEFEYIIYGNSHRKLPFYSLVKSLYDPEKIVILCGSERYGGAPHTHYCGYRGIVSNLFIREWSPDMYYSEDNSDKDNK